MELAVQTRETVGKSTKALRKQGFIPAEIYGRGLENAHLAVDAKTFRKVYKEAGENTVLTLLVGKDKRSALVHDIQRDSISDEIIHVDFYQVRMDEKLTAKVPVEFVGEAPAVKAYGGVLNKSLTEIEVEALPADLPHRLTADLSTLVELNQSVYIKDIPVPKGVQIQLDPETVVATVTEMMKEEEVAPAPVVDVSEVKVESEEKKAERDQQKAAEAEEK